MTINKTLSGFHSVSHDRPLLEQSIDAYRMKGKLPEPTVCPKCNAVLHGGALAVGRCANGCSP